MASEKKKLPVIPKSRVKEGEVPQLVAPDSGKYNVQVKDGDFIEVPLDKHGMPLLIIPDRRRKDK